MRPLCTLSRSISHYLATCQFCVVSLQMETEVSSLFAFAHPLIRSSLIAHRSPSHRSPLTFNLINHYGNIQQQHHLGQDPQHRNHHPHGHSHHIRHGKLHVTNGKVKTENGNLFYPPLCRFATMSSRRNGNCSPRLDTEAHSVLPLRSSSPLSQVRSQLQPTCGHTYNH